MSQYFCKDCAIQQQNTWQQECDTSCKGGGAGVIFWELQCYLVVYFNTILENILHGRDEEAESVRKKDQKGGDQQCSARGGGH